MINSYEYLFKKRKSLFLLSIFLITTLTISTINFVSAADITISSPTWGGGGLSTASYETEHGIFYIKQCVITVLKKSFLLPEEDIETILVITALTVLLFLITFH